MQATADFIRNSCGAALSVPGDVTEPAFPRRLVEAAVSAYGGLDILVNNAGTVCGTMQVQSAVGSCAICFLSSRKSPKSPARCAAYTRRLHLGRHASQDARQAVGHNARGALHRPLPPHPGLCCAVLCCAVLCCAVLGWAAPLLCCAVLCCAMGAQEQAVCKRRGARHKLTAQHGCMVSGSASALPLPLPLPCSQAAAPHMREAAKREMESRGRPRPRCILNVSSVSGGLEGWMTGRCVLAACPAPPSRKAAHAPSPATCVPWPMPRRRTRQRGPGQLRDGQDGGGGADQGCGQGVGPIWRALQRAGLWLHPDAVGGAGRAAGGRLPALHMCLGACPARCLAKRVPLAPAPARGCLLSAGWCSPRTGGRS